MTYGRWLANLCDVTTVLGLKNGLPISLLLLAIIVWTLALRAAVLAAVFLSLGPDLLARETRVVLWLHLLRHALESVLHAEGTTCW